MKNYFSFTLIVVFIIITAISGFCQDQPMYADLGDFKLENGSVIKSCKLAYRTMGIPNEKKSNAILIPTWLAGTTQELFDLGFIGPSKIIDTTRYYVIAVDSLGNGVSSSPSNSKFQPDTAFPVFTNRDIVNAQHHLLIKILNIKHLYAVVGVSMGGMQTFQWMVSYPGFMDKAIPIEGSPWMTSYDLLAWHAELKAIENSKRCNGKNDEAMKAVALIHLMNVWSPAYRVSKTGVNDFAKFLEESEKIFTKYNATDWAWQLKAIMSQDITRDFGSSAKNAAKAVSAKTLVITSKEDYAVYPETAREFASMIKADTAELKGSCGHLSFICETEKLKDLVGGFISQ